jgi:RHS repeat-associated protein
MFMSWGQ